MSRRAPSAWVQGSAVGWASAAEVDEVGIMRALGLAAIRALADLSAHGFQTAEAIVILDGNYDYITAAGARGLTVRPVIKADRDCASAAAASVIAKVARDALMVGPARRPSRLQLGEQQGLREPRSPRGDPHARHQPAPPGVVGAAAGDAVLSTDRAPSRAALGWKHHG